MRYLLLAALIFSYASAQPPGPPGPPGPTGPAGKPSGPTTTSSAPGGAANLSLPHVVGKLKGFSPTRFTIQREMGAGGPTANMDFRADAKTVLSEGLKSGDRAVVVYEMNPKGEGYRALAAIRCPEGSNPETLLKSLPKLKP